MMVLLLGQKHGVFQTFRWSSSLLEVGVKGQLLDAAKTLQL